MDRRQAAFGTVEASATRQKPRAVLATSSLFVGKRAVYFGRSAEIHVELFPQKNRASAALRTLSESAPGSVIKCPEELKLESTGDGWEYHPTVDCVLQRQIKAVLV